MAREVGQDGEGHPGLAWESACLGTTWPVRGRTVARLLEGGFEDDLEFFFSFEVTVACVFTYLC